MTDKLLHIVIPFYSNTDLLNNCLSALDKSDLKHLFILLVDHSITGIPADSTRSHSLQVKYIRGSSDLWWSGATNLGIKYALSNNAEHIMLLNHDCLVRPDTIGNLVKASEELGGKSIVASIQHNLDTGKSIVRAYTLYALGFPTICFPVADSSLQINNSYKETKLIIGGRGVIIPATIFDDAGMFDESRLPHYGADHDFYLRCRQMEYHLYISMNAIVDLDNRSTSIAGNPGNMSIKEFFGSLSSRNSHRNIFDLASLFRLHYPIPALYPVGLVLNVFRYLGVYIISRLLKIVRF